MHVPQLAPGAGEPQAESSVVVRGLGIRALDVHVDELAPRRADAAQSTRARPRGRLDEDERTEVGRQALEHGPDACFMTCFKGTLIPVHGTSHVLRSPIQRKLESMLFECSDARSNVVQSASCRSTKNGRVSRLKCGLASALLLCQTRLL